MDEKIKTWPLRFPAKETLIWRRHCSIGQSCCSMTSKKFLESSSGMKFVYPRVRLANQNPGAFVSVSYTNQIALFPFVCCFCFVRAFSFQGHTKIALVNRDQALFSFRSRSVNNIPVGKAKRKESLIQTFYETPAVHFFD